MSTHPGTRDVPYLLTLALETCRVHSPWHWRHSHHAEDREMRMPASEEHQVLRR